MSNKKTFDKKIEEDERQQCYEIRLKGHLDDQWSDWFDGMIITLEEDGNTLLTGPVIDQSELHGLLKKVRDIGIPLVSVSPPKPVPQTMSICREKTQKKNTGNQ